MAWIDPQWELDPDEDAKRMAQKRPPLNWRANNTIRRLTLVVMIVVFLCLIAGSIVALR